MKRRNFLKKIIAASLPVFLLAGLCLPTGNTQIVLANAQEELNLSEVEIPGEDSILAGIRGSYVAEQQAALDRINEIRLEACTNGYPDPRNQNRKLTLEDYVPIKWSSKLEQRARIRAAEAVVYTSHTRPGSNIPVNQNTDYAEWSEETLAWPGRTLKGGVNQWYGEKETWIEQSEGVTGHYTSMINPDNIYVGLGGFMVDSESLGSGWGGCVCGHFQEQNRTQEPDGTMAPEIKNVIQAISIKKDYLSEPEIQNISYSTNKNTLTQGSTVEYAVVRQAKFSSSEQAVLLDMDSYTFSSSNLTVLKIDSNGQGKALKNGTAMITATGSGGAVYEKAIKVKSSMKAPKSLKLQTGKKKLDVYFKVTLDTANIADGFQIQVAGNKKFTKNLKNIQVKNPYQSWAVFTDYKKTIKKLKAKKTYYVRVRAYVKIDGQKYYTSWSGVKNKKTLK